MDSVKSKRFSFAGFSSGLSRSLSFSSGTKVKKEDEILPSLEKPIGISQEEQRKLKRAQKSKSLYIKSFNKKTTTPTTQYDASEAVQSNSKEIRSSIRRSLSAVLYASPHLTDDDDKSYSSKLVPILVTPELSDSVGGILIDDGSKNKVKNNEEKAIEVKKKKKPVEYDNSLEVFSKDGDTTIIWQGYGYIITKEGQEEVGSELMRDDLESRFEKEIWNSYRGLIHPLHLFKEDSEQEVIKRGRWAGLSVTELQRYYDNYGSMLLKIRETRMLEQQKQYQHLLNVKKEWIIPNIIKDQ